jgi:hypothetical protein
MANPSGKATACWVWTGPVDVTGRPMIYNQEQSWPIARLLYVIQNGPLTERQVVSNDCGVTRCCRPDHHRVENKGPIRRPPYAAGTLPVCANGHPQYPENRYTFRGKVYCRMCHADNQRRYRQKRGPGGVSRSSASP